MANKVRFVDPGIIVQSSGGSGGSSISSSYALSASYADFSTSASYADYALSASHEIVKEVSSSYADTASFAQSGEGPFTGSFTGSFTGDGTGLFSGSFSGSIPDAYQIISGSVSASISPDNGLRINSPVDITLISGSAFTIHEPDIDQKNRLDFKFEQGNPILEIASRSTTSSLFLKQDQTGNGFLFTSQGFMKFISGTSSFGAQFTSQFKPIDTTGVIDIGFKNRRWRDLYLMKGSRISFGNNNLPASNQQMDIVHTENSGRLTLTGSYGAILDVEGQVSASTYLGNGSQLTGIDSGSWDGQFTGDAEITGSLIVSGSLNAFVYDSSNVNLGHNAGLNLEDGATANVLIGKGAGENINFGDGNVIIGRAAGSNANNGYNTFLGAYSGQLMNATGGENVAVGYKSGNKGDSNAQYNSFLGAYSGENITSGKRNLALGYMSGYNLTSGNNNIILGHSASLASPTASNQLFIGSGSTSLISGLLDVGNLTFGSIESGKSYIVVSNDSALYNTFINGELYLGQDGVTPMIHFGSNNIIYSIRRNGAQGLTIGNTEFNSGNNVSIYRNLEVGRNTGNIGSNKLTVTGSAHIQGSGSTVFDVIGSEGTLLSVDDELDGTVFTANDRTGLPILEVSASGEVWIGKSPQSLYTTAVISSTSNAITQSIFGLSTSSYDGAFFDYTVQSGSNARAGSIISVWNGSNINFTETTTLDIGNTSGFNLIVHISESQAQLAQHSDTNGYKIKTIIRSI